MGLIALKSKRAEKITDLTGTAKPHLKALEGYVKLILTNYKTVLCVRSFKIFFSLKKINLTGEPSLQNGLDLAMKTLKVVPSHASREILIIMGSLTTCDPIDINQTIETLKQEGIRCSVISLSAEIHVCRYLTTQTNGTYGAVLDDSHYRDQLLSHVDPPPAAQMQENSLIKMGFPHAKQDEGKDPPLSMCMCHIENSDEPSKLTSGGFHCPQCFSKYCELPVECQTCGLTLVSAPHLARSYHHLFPVPHFTELVYNGQAAVCYACQKPLTEASDKNVYRCESCSQVYCIDCDIFIHETLHICVGCNTIPGVAAQVHSRKPQAPPPSMMMVGSSLGQRF